MPRVASDLLRSILLPTFMGLTWAVSSLSAAEGPDSGFAAADLEFFEKQVRPVLIARCYECHSAHSKPPKGGLRVDSREGLLAGGDTGPAIDTRQPNKSLLLDAINYGEIYQMPPKSRLPEPEITALTKWIERGAPWPQQTDAAIAETQEFDLQSRRANHWCWQPVVPRPPPAVQRSDWPNQPLDHFILARLEAKGLAPSPSTDPHILLRRVCFDVIGLPPSAAQVERFVQDPSSRAFEQLVDELLDSPHFGERWARHWLDLVRYAETCGHEFDFPIHNAWRYRDYLIRAFNANIPYDQLVREHIAGDLLPRPRINPETKLNESICGTAFWWLYEALHAPVDVRGDEASRIDNQIDVFSKTFLGLTVACARCHDHKFDAIATRDYYALAGVLRSTRRQQALLDPGGQIQELANRARQLRAERQQSTREWLSRQELLAGGATSFQRHLLAVREVLQGVPQPGEAASAAGHRRAISSVAEQYGLSARSLTAWLAAFADPAVRDANHPLGIWWELALARSEAPLGEHFAAWREQRKAGDKERSSAAGEYEVLADFDDGTYSDWFRTGAAFGDGPATPGEWEVHSQQPRIVESGIAHSGQLSTRFQGVLRSPTFTIGAPNIFYRMAGRGCELRLIIDGYTMIEFNQLLFAGCKFPIDTDGKWIWHRQAGDLGMYLGHRAYIEVIDHGDGWAALDQVCCSNRDTPPPSASTDYVTDISDDLSVASLEMLAERLNAIWLEAVKRWRIGELTASDARLINWALTSGLLATNQSAPTERPADSLAAILSETNRQIDDLLRDLPKPVQVTAACDGTGENERVFIRGNPRVLGDEVPRQLLVALVGQQPPIEQGSGRLRLAEHVASPSNPLTARVLVNRIWHHLLGRGLVPPIDNFGVLGEAPTHPELLDYLADQFVTDGWSIKRLIRTIVLSRTYQMSSSPRSDCEQVDASNRLWHRALVRRLEGEAIRDAILAISGQLDRSAFGPAVPIHITPFMQGRGKPGTSGPLDGAGRRSVYLEVRRNFLSPMMLAFDSPVPFSTVGRRNTSNVPAQALILMNDPFVVEQAQRWAERLLSTTDLEFEQRVRRAYLQAIARPPSEEELAEITAFFAEQGRQYENRDGAQSDARVWADFCHVLFNVKEFTFLP